MKTVISIIAAALLASGCSGPLGPIPGGSLGGAVASTPTDWSFAQNADHIQLETSDDSGAPYSVNVWSGVYQGRLFVPTSLVRGAEEPEARGWVQNALANQRARVRIDGQLYNAHLSRVLDPQLESKVKQTILEKYDSAADARSSRAWVFEVIAHANG